MRSSECPWLVLGALTAAEVEELVFAGALRRSELCDIKVGHIT